MRLIDADALRRWIIDRQYAYNDNLTVEDILDMINQSKTIEVITVTDIEHHKRHVRFIRKDNTNG